MLTYDQFTPEEAQERNKPLIQDLCHYYDTRTEDEASLARIRERLLQKTVASLPTAETEKIIQLPTGLRAGDTRMKFIHASVKGKARPPYLTTLAAAVLLVVLLGSFALVLQRLRDSGSPGTASISNTLSSCASQPGPVLVDLCTHHQFTNLLQSHKMGTYVIVLERAYLDMNQLLITYRVFSQATGRQTPADLTDTLVTTSQGISFKSSGGAVPATGLGVVQFSTPALPADTHTLQFQVKVKALQLPMLKLPAPGTPLPQPAVVHGSATFNFTLFYHDGLVVTPHQTVTVNGNSVTLERVLISPSETIIEGMTKGTIPTATNYTFLLDAAGRHSSPTFLDFGGAENPFNIRYEDELLGQHGTWTFEISSASGQGGPWVFHFMVP